jgi:hypothetical protein
LQIEFEIIFAILVLIQKVFHRKLLNFVIGKTKWIKARFVLDDLQFTKAYSIIIQLTKFGLFLLVYFENSFTS